MEISRCENRPNDKIRSISVKVGVIESADGSAEFSLGNTRVLAVVHGPVAAKSRLEQIDRATLKVTVESLDTPPSLKNVAMAQRLESILQSVIFDLLNPRTLVSITIQPISLDGSYFAVAFNAAVAALLDSGFPMIRLAFAASCLVDSSQNLIIDPDFSEENSSLKQSEHMIVYDPNDFDRSVAMNHFGKFDFPLLPKISEFIAQSAIIPISEAVKASIVEKLEKL